MAPIGGLSARQFNSCLLCPAEKRREERCSGRAGPVCRHDPNNMLSTCLTRKSQLIESLIVSRQKVRLIGTLLSLENLTKHGHLSTAPVNRPRNHRARNAFSTVNTKDINGLLISLVNTQHATCPIEVIKNTAHMTAVTSRDATHNGRDLSKNASCLLGGLSDIALNVQGSNPQK